jgi:ribonuclease P protein component
VSISPPVPPSDFPPSARLRVSAEFQAVFKAGRRLSSPQLRLFAHVRAEASAPRLGVAVSKKVDKRAVGRNRIKRLARETFRRERHQLPPGDYVLIAQPGASALSSDELRAQWLQLLERARSLKPTPPAGTMPDSPVARERPASES